MCVWIYYDRQLTISEIQISVNTNEADLIERSHCGFLSLSLLNSTIWSFISTAF